MDALTVDDGLDLSGNNEVSSTVMRKLGICYKIAKLMQTDGRFCLLGRGMTLSDRHRKAAALHSLVQELTDLTGQHFTAKQITKCLSNMRNRLKERMTSGGNFYGGRLGGWERELLTVYKQGGLLSDLNTEDTPINMKLSRKGSKRKSALWKYSSSSGLPTQVQRVATLTGSVRSRTRNGVSLNSRTLPCVPINTLKVTVPKLAVAKPVTLTPLAKRAVAATDANFSCSTTVVREVELQPEPTTKRASRVTKQSAGRQNVTRVSDLCSSRIALRRSAASVAMPHPLLPSRSPSPLPIGTLQFQTRPSPAHRGTTPPFLDGVVNGKSIDVSKVHLRPSKVSEAALNGMELEPCASDADADGRNELVSRSPWALNEVASITNHTDTAREQQLAEYGAAATQTSVGTQSHFEFETGETSLLTNEQLHRLVLLEQLAYVRLKRNLLAQRILADTSQPLLVNDRQLNESATGC